MTKKATIATLEELHNAVAKELLKRIKSAEAKPADFAAAIKFLKDNGIEAIAAPGTPLGNLAADLPFPTEDDTYVN